MTGVQRLARWFLTYVIDVHAIRLMVRQPKQWILARAHHPWTGLTPLALIAGRTYFGWYSPYWLWTFAVVYGALSFGTDAVGSGLHSLWQRDRIWQDTVCPCCEEHGGGDWWSEFPDFPDGPEDHGRRPDDSRTPSLHTVTTPRERAAQAAFAATNLEGLR